MSEEKKRRIQAPPVRYITPVKEDPRQIVVPKIENLLSDAMVIIHMELKRYKDKVTKRGEHLTAQEARIITNYSEAVSKLNREARESARMADFSAMTEEELYELAGNILKPKRSEAKSDPKPEPEEEKTSVS